MNHFLVLIPSSSKQQDVLSLRTGACGQFYIEVQSSYRMCSAQLPGWSLGQPPRKVALDPLEGSRMTSALLPSQSSQSSPPVGQGTSEPRHSDMGAREGFPEQIGLN